MKLKISIITAIHNGIDFNRLFLHSVLKHTYHHLELIIVDNISSDGSAELFEKHGAIVIKNNRNYSYPYTQNQGIKIATGDYLFFLNNDLILCPNWDKILIDTARQNGLDIVSAKGIENMGNKTETRKLDRKWKRIKNPLMLLGNSENNFRLMHYLMYGNWNKFCSKAFEKFGYKAVEGIVGNNVMMTRNALSKVGCWDERIQSADFDLFMRTKKRALQVGDIKPCHIALGAYVHHFIRMTSKYGARKPVPFADGGNLINLDKKWTAQDLELLHPDNETLRKTMQTA